MDIRPKDDVLRRCEQLMAQPSSSAAAKLLQDHPDLQIACEHRYPYLHRITDFQINGKPFRLGRCYSCGERLSLTVAEQAVPQEGVPLWLTGRKLGYWVRSEAKRPSDGPTNWEALRRKLEGADIAALEKTEAAQDLEAERAVRRLLGSDENPGGPFLPVDPQGP